MAQIVVKDVTVIKGQETLLAKINFVIPDAKLTLAIDPDGDSETALVNLIGGILVPESGHVYIDNTDLFTGSDDEILEARKKLSFVFQNGGLISNLSILENLLLPMNLYFPEVPRKVKMDRIQYEIERFQLPPILDKRPAEVPRRFAKMMGFIRAIITDPAVIVMEEPFANCDVIMREKIFREILQQKVKGVTLISASNTSEVIFNVADWIIILERGQILASGEAHELIASPDPLIGGRIKRYLGG